MEVRAKIGETITDFNSEPRGDRVGMTLAEEMCPGPLRHIMQVWELQNAEAWGAGGVGGVSGEQFGEGRWCLVTEGGTARLRGMNFFGRQSGTRDRIRCETLESSLRNMNFGKWPRHSSLPVI